jgi:hypothetical protein
MFLIYADQHEFIKRNSSHVADRARCLSYPVSDLLTGVVARRLRVNTEHSNCLADLRSSIVRSSLLFFEAFTETAANFTCDDHERPCRWIANCVAAK